MNVFRRHFSDVAAAKHAPIAPEEYLNLVLSLWGKIPPRLGLAVSGGVDSMALAHLTRTLPSVESGDTKLHAFIVDHKLRKGSAQEAEAVAEALNALKITPHVMQMDWGGPLPQAVETIGRMKRYQLMARKSVELNINRVLLGHHEDDRAETVLFRILSNSRGEGLATMKPDSRMPERYSVYGADDIRIGRPFTTVPKARLIATCQANDIKWFEDETNKNPLITPRNAIRKLLSEEHDHLPRALQKSSLIALSDRVTAISDARYAEAQRIIDTECNLRFNPAWGSLHLNFPERKLETMEVAEQRVMLRVVILLAQMITPNRIERKSDVATNVLVKLFQGRIGRKDQVTGMGLIWRRNIDGNWDIWRAPKRGQRRAADRALNEAHQVPVAKSVGQWTEWQLWDGRWWMRFKGHTDVISIRVLRDEDIALVHKSFYHAVKTGQLKELPVLPTEKFRYTLPIVLIGEHKVALPSMGIMLTDLKNTPFKNFKYECKFRPPQ